MKKLLGLLLFFMFFIKLLPRENVSYIFYFCCYIGLPMIWLPLFNRLIIKNKDNKEFNDDLNFIINKIFSVFSFFFILFIILTFLYQINSIKFNGLYVNLMYFSCIISITIVVNFYGIKSSLIKYRVKAILNSFCSYFEENVFFNIIVFIFLFVFRNNTTLFSGIVGSYLFYFFTEVSKQYKKYVKKLNQVKSNQQTQFSVCILNIVLFYYLFEFEKMFNAIVNQTSYNDSYCSSLIIFLLVLVVALNRFFNFKCTKNKKGNPI